MSWLPLDTAFPENEVAGCLLRLDAWLQTMRGPGGYGGPIAHWWESCLLYAGAMADWRYEGILDGYVRLYRATGQEQWLQRARQAADDLVVALLPSGLFRNSAFQQGPMEGGTPHEAAVDAGLLTLAHLLKEQQNEAWKTYFAVAQQNIERYQLGQLWNGQGFRDQPWNEKLVPNKNATTAEALILYETLSGQDMSLYIDKIVRVILAAQEQQGPRAGGIVHTGTGRHQLAVGIYVARSICGLLRIYERSPDERLLQAVYYAVGFLRGLFSPRRVAFGRYRHGRVIANPAFHAGAGDILRAIIWARQYELASHADITFLTALLTAAQLPSGGIMTASGFAGRGDTQPYQGGLEFRDVLPVVGWCDKAFRALTMLIEMQHIKLDESAIPSADGATTERECRWKKRLCVFAEDTHMFSLRDAHNGMLLYRWQKGLLYPDIYHL
jgi:hypothetical protein